MYIFVTGSDTDVGKSYVARGICQELTSHDETVGYLKPFQSGVIDVVLNEADTITLNNQSIKTISSYITRTPSTPLISAEIDSVDYDLNKITNDYELLKKECRNVIVEVSGGIYVPVKKWVFMIDIIKRLNLPTLIVARPDLGTINHTLMTIDCLINNDIKVLGVVISKYHDKTTDTVISRAKELIEILSEMIQ